MNNENNGIGTPVPPQGGPTGLNDIINNNAGIPGTQTPVGPAPQPAPQIQPEPVPVNPLDQVVTPQPINMMGAEQNSVSLDNQVVMPSTTPMMNAQPMQPAPPVQEPAPQPAAPAPQAPIQNENAYVATPAAPVQSTTPVQPAAPNMMPSGQPMPSFTPGTIGTNPPINPEEPAKAKKDGKKGMNKTLFIVLLIVLMAAIGGGIYWYLNLSKGNELHVSLKDVAYNLNEEPSTDISDYATITGANSSSCVLDTSKIDTTKVDQYEYTITCNGQVFKGKAIVADNSAPIISTISVYKTVNSEVEPSEFIATCYDSGECTYKFEDESAVKAAMTTPGGPTKINIVVTDENNNSVTVEGNLNVIESEIRAYYDCSSAGQNVENFNATMTLTHSLGILKNTATDGSLAFGNFGTQTYVYTFTDQEQYDQLLTSFKNDNKIIINDVTGVPTFDEEKMTITMISDLDLTGLKTQYGEDKFISFKTVSELYKTTLGYTCQQKTN